MSTITMKTKILIEGPVFRIETICINDRDEVGDFLAQLEKSSCQEYINVLALLERIADNGLPQNREKYRQVEGDIFEIKSYRVRLLHFRQGKNLLVITNPVHKKRNRLPQSDVKKAQERCRRYREQIGSQKKGD